MKVVFIAGPYYSSDPIQVSRNILDAKEIALECAENGVGFMCTHLNSANFHMLVTDQECEMFFNRLARDLMWRCDGLLMLPKWRESTNAQVEHEAWIHAQGERQKDIFYCIEKPERFANWAHLPQELIEWNEI